jgi:hypothetical protein
MLKVLFYGKCMFAVSASMASASQKQPLHIGEVLRSTRRPAWRSKMNIAIGYQSAHQWCRCSARKSPICRTKYLKYQHEVLIRTVKRVGGSALEYQPPKTDRKPP